MHVTRFLLACLTSMFLLLVAAIMLLGPGCICYSAITQSGFGLCVMPGTYQITIGTETTLDAGGGDSAGVVHPN